MNDQTQGLQGLAGAFGGLLGQTPGMEAQMQAPEPTRVTFETLLDHGGDRYSKLHALINALAEIVIYLDGPQPEAPDTDSAEIDPVPVMDRLNIQHWNELKRIGDLESLVKRLEGLIR
jgi:hypothetical protein